MASFIETVLDAVGDPEYILRGYKQVALHYLAVRLQSVSIVSAPYYLRLIQLWFDARRYDETIPVAKRVWLYPHLRIGSNKILVSLDSGV